MLPREKLEEFKQWLDAEGIEHRPGRGSEWQVLQVKSQTTNDWYVIFDRKNRPTHYTVPETLVETVGRYLDECGWYSSEDNEANYPKG